MANRRGGANGTLFIITIVALLIAAGALAIAFAPRWFGMGEERIDASQLDASFNQIAELSVEEYAYSNVGSYDQEGLMLRDLNVPFTGKNFLVTYDGSVKAGIKNADDIRVEIDDNNRLISVWSPRPEVISSTIDSPTVTVHDQSMNPLNQVRVDDVTHFINEQERLAETKAIERGLIYRATERTEELLANHARALAAGTELAEYQVMVRFTE